MKYLLDTHVLLWSLLATRELSNKVKQVFTDPETIKYVSVISFWEISLKFALGKIALRGVLPEQFPEVVEKTGFEILSLNPKTAASFYKLRKFKNKDPFDRMLAWQAIREDCVLVTRDKDFSDYKDEGLGIVW